MRSGELTPSAIPRAEDAASRDLSRARAEAIRARKAVKVRLNALLLRHARRSTGRATWGPAPRRWLAEGIWATPAQHLVCQADVRAVTDHPACLERLEPERQAPPKPWRLLPVVAAWQARRGVQCTVAVTRGAARGALTRGDTPRPLMSDGGVTPSA